MLITFSLTLGIVALCVVIHYEVLYRLSSFIGKLPISPRQQVVTGVMLALGAQTE